MSSTIPAIEALKLRKETSLAVIIREEIARLIEAGELLPGAWVNEAELAARFGTSRQPVREACRGLEQNGLLRFVNNRGAFVRDVSIKEAEDIYDLRAALFALAGRLLAPTITEDGLAVLEGLIVQMENAAAAHTLEVYYPLNLQFHRTILQFSGNERLLAAYQGCVRELHLFRRGALVTKERMLQSNIEHRKIFEALRARNPKRASLLMEAHVLDSKRRMLTNQADG